MAMTREDGTLTAGVGKDVGKEDPAKKKNAILELLGFAGKRRVLAYVGCGLSLLNAVLTVMPLVCVWFVVRDLVSVYPNWAEASSAAMWAVLAVVFAVLGIIVYFGALMASHLAAFRIAANMRKAMVRHVARIPIGYFSAHSSGEMRRVIDGCAGQTEDLIAHKLPDFVGSFATPVIFFVVAFLFDWRMGLLCLVPIAVSFAAMWWMMGREDEKGGRHFMELYQAALMRMSAAATEYVRGIPVVKVFQQTVLSFKAFHEAIIDYRDMATNYTEYCRRPQVVQLVAINSTFAVLVPAGIALAAVAPDFPAFLIDFLFYAFFSAMTTTMMSKIMYSSEAVMIAEDALRRMNTIMEVAPIAEVESAKAHHPKGASIELAGVSFSYPGSREPALRNVSLSVPAGATVALVGPSGGGKSTLASLVPRFWDADEGAVLVGGVDVRHIPAEELMGAVSFVFQDDRLFKRSLTDNVRAGRPDASDAEVLASLHAAQCDDIIAKFPDGVNTVVGKAGVYLSGGERQRIALARAILKDAPIVVLDEATAFADPENETLIQAALATLCEDKTVLMIAHRLSTVVNADRIFVIDRGCVAEQGAHEELVAQGGLYARMWRDYRTSATWRIEGGDSHVA